MAERVVASFDTPEQLASAVTRALFVWHEERRQATESRGWRRPRFSLAPRSRNSRSARTPIGASRRSARRMRRASSAARRWSSSSGRRSSRCTGRGADGETPIRLLPILGPSGSGKSSVAQAGLLAALDERPLPGRPAAPSVVFTPEARPLESLAVALARHVTGDPAPAQKAMEFEQVLRERADGDGLRFLGAQMLGSAGVVLLVDQFEETLRALRGRGGARAPSSATCSTPRASRAGGSRSSSPCAAISWARSTSIRS